jgi:large subunit ribosomal protein L13
VNAAKLDISARKAVEKQYYRHSGYPGGLKQSSLQDMIERHPDRVIKLAVKGMLPKGRLGRAMLKKLRVYPGAAHPHAAQNPVDHALPARARKAQ